LRRTIVSKKDYRPVCKAVWEFYFVAYGGGPVILFHGTDSLSSLHLPPHPFQCRAASMRSFTKPASG
jgi:hypothetical protein